jgi:predicted RNase H-like HicB family nuclease
MTLCVQCERDEDGRWLAKMPGAIAYGDTIEEAMAKAEALALRVAAEPGNQGEAHPIDVSDGATKTDDRRGDGDIAT